MPFCVFQHIGFTNGEKVTTLEALERFIILAGFLKELFDLEYPTKGSPELALKLQKYCCRQKWNWMTLGVESTLECN
jgi:aromatic ring-opening dioxygenase catalytic subunit (LigB family)